MEANDNSNPVERVDKLKYQQNKNRHIVFVGNLPYTATESSIREHFSSLSPIGVRCLHQAGNIKKCRGIAFVEFSSAATQRKCLDTFHLSAFDDGESPARKINLELTAGGGGRNANRRMKLKVKNEKLNLNRAKRLLKIANSQQKGQSSQPNPNLPRICTGQEGRVASSIRKERRNGP
jgi:nucleolar protein 6